MRSAFYNNGDTRESAAASNMNDSRLKPWLLHSIMATHLPDDKQPTRAPIQLSMAVASIRRHHLLSEISPMLGTMLIQQGGKTMDGRKGAVEAWIDRLMSLLASSVAENRWAGVCLLGVTCLECSRQRFLDSYSTWFQRLLTPLKPTDPIFVRAAACASLTDLLTRLGGLIDCAGVRRDAGPLVGKLVQPVLHILGDKESNGIWNEALELLFALLKHFPSCLRQHFNQTELLLVAQLVDGDCTSSLSQKCAQCLALLPRVLGDVSSWSSLIRRLLIAVNNELDAAFAGLEDPADTAGSFPPVGQEAPWPTVCQPLGTNGASLVLKNYWQQVVPRVSSMLNCCCRILVSSYPVPVTVPVGPLLNVVMRILHVDGSRVPTAALGIPISTAQQASLCSELPTLHLSALDLLSATVQSTRSQLLPQGADVVRIMSDYSKRNPCTPPGIRIKLYAISQQLILMGAGMASALAPAVVAQALGDLICSSPGSSLFSPKGARTPRMNNVVWTQGGWAGGQPPNHRKRKEPGSLPCDQVNGMGDAIVPSIEGGDPISVQTAALQAMEALLTCGGALLPDRWRAEVDAVLANVAVSASTSTLSLAVDEELMDMEGITSGRTVAFQVAAYRALLASLLSPCCHRPPHLAQALAIFRKGRQDGGKEVAEICAHALLSLEPLIHPRCLPPAGTPAAVVAGMATGRATAVGTPVGAFYGTDAQQSGVSKLVPRNDEDVGLVRVASGFVGPNDRKQGSPLGGEAEGAHLCVVAPNPSHLQEEVVQIDGPYLELNPPAGSEATQAVVSMNNVGALPTKGDVSQTSRLLPVANNSEAGVATADMQPTHMDTDLGAGIAERKEPGRPGSEAGSVLPVLEAPAAARTAFSGPRAHAGSESDSDGPLPDIVDGDPDSD